jgi:hypothetical protein
MVKRDKRRKTKDEGRTFILRLSSVLALFALFSLFALAQTIPEPPANPINFFVRALQREAVTNLRGEVREVQVFPPRQVPEQTRTDLPAPPPLLPAWIRRNFNVSVELGEQVAGRETWRIRLQPKNSSAASYVFWIDQKWQVRLAAEERDSSSEVVYTARFVRVGTPTQRQQARQLNLLEPKPKLQSFVQAQTGLQLPDGFEVVEIRPRTVSKDNLPALEVRASNGIGVLVYVFAPVGTANTPRIVSRKLAARTFVWVVGNLSRPELERSASSVGAGLNLDSLLLSFQGLR